MYTKPGVKKVHYWIVRVFELELAGPTHCMVADDRMPHVGSFRGNLS